MMMNVSDIRTLLLERLQSYDFIIDNTGSKTIELVGQSFLANENSIYGTPSIEYISREIEWYTSQSLYVNDIQGKTPKIWQDISSAAGAINSNYGWCIYSKENQTQFLHCLIELLNNRYTRRATMIYTRPEMQTDYCIDGMSDYMCTWGVQYLIRNNKLNAVVNMRSNDVVYGYKNDFAWQSHVLDLLVDEYNRKADIKVNRGDIIWNAGSLHLYERHFDLVTGRDS